MTVVFVNGLHKTLSHLRLKCLQSFLSVKRVALIQVIRPALPVGRGRAWIAAPLRGSLAAALRRGSGSNMRALLRLRRKATAAACHPARVREHRTRTLSRH